MAKSFNDLPPVVQATVLVVAAVALAGAVFWFEVVPVYKEIESLDKDVQRLKAENEKLQIFERQRPEYLIRIESLKKQIETQRAFVPDDPNQDQFIRTVHEASLVTGINVRTFIAQAQVPHDFYVEMPFSTRLDGTYYTLLSFFDRLAHDTRIVSVSSITLGGPAGGGMGAYQIRSGETVGANVVLVTYYNRAQPAAPTAQPAKK